MNNYDKAGESPQNIMNNTKLCGNCTQKYVYVKTRY